jgi:charged multivesicular body protein 2A
LEKAQRELDKERIKLEKQEKQLIADIKKNAKNGQLGACKIQAKDLVRTRKSVQQPPASPLTMLRYIEKFYGMKTQLQAVSLRIQVINY